MPGADDGGDDKGGMGTMGSGDPLLPFPPIYFYSLSVNINRYFLQDFFIRSDPFLASKKLLVNLFMVSALPRQSKTADTVFQTYPPTLYNPAC